MLNMCRTRCRGTLPTTRWAVAFWSPRRRFGVIKNKTCREVEAASVSHRHPSRSRFRLTASLSASSSWNNSRLDSNLALWVMSGLHVSLNFFLGLDPQWRKFFFDIKKIGKMCPAPESRLVYLFTLEPAAGFSLPFKTPAFTVPTQILTVRSAESKRKTGYSSINLL